MNLQRAENPPRSGSSPLVVLAGNLGAGKTTLAGRLGERFGWWVGYESVNDNPYLDDFYRDMGAWAFHLQIYFLNNRLRLHREAERMAQGSVLDRSIYEDRFIFAESLYEQGHIPSREFQTYVNLFDAAVEALRKPDLVIFVTAPTEALSERLSRRAQTFDHNLPRRYLDKIGQKYVEWTRTLPADQLLVVDSTIADFSADALTSPGMEDIFSRISDMLES